ncbi:MAG: ABC transporter permease [Haloarculaceae archaeon]
MTVLRVVAKRVVMGLAAAWTVLTGVFALFTLTPDWVIQQRVRAMQYGGASQAHLDAVREQYLSARGLNRPLLDQYAHWLGNMVTLHWGHSFSTGDRVLPTVLDAAARTATYVLPAIVLAIAVGVLIGVYAALRPESRLAGAGVGSSYVLFAVPGFWIGGLLLSLALDGVVGQSELVFGYLLPIALTTAALLGGYVSYSRAHAREYASADFVRLVRAKGATDRRVAVHVLRNAAVPIFSMLFTEAIGLLVLSVFVVETLLGIDGFGLLLVRSVDQRDLPVILGGILLVIGVGVLGNVIQDLSYAALDPRVETDS